MGNFRAIKDIAADLKSYIVTHEIVENVDIQSSTDYDELSKIVSRTSRTTGAIIVPGPGEHPATGTRNKCVMTFYVFLKGTRASSRNDVYDILQAFRTIMMPTETKLNEAIQIKGVIYELDSWRQEVSSGCDVIQVVLEITDSRLSDAERLLINRNNFHIKEIENG